MPPLRSPSSFRWWIAPAVLVALVVVCASGTWLLVPRSSASLIKLARSAADRKDWNAAKRYALEAADVQPGAAEPWLLMAQWSLRNRQYEAAVDAWERVPDDSPSAPDARLRAAATCMRQLRHLSRAERNFRLASKLAPNNSEVVDGLAQVLAIEGRWSELPTSLLRLIQLDAYTNFHLDLLVRGPELNVDPQLLPAYAQTRAEDLVSRCAHARSALQSGNESQARDDLNAILKHAPECVPARLLLGRLLLASGADSELMEWLRNAPSEVRNSPDYWRVAMSASQRWHDDDGERRCAWETLIRDPNDPAACLSLGRGLRQRGDLDLAAALVQRAERLERYMAVVSSARRPRHWDAMKQAVELSESLGLYWESFGWCQLAARLNPALTWPQPILDRLQPRLALLELVRTDPAANPVLRLDPKQFPVPRFDSTIPETTANAVCGSESTIAFREEAFHSGLKFQYHNGGDCLRTGLQKMYEFTGGGVGVVDCDRDGFADLYFPQGGEFASRGSPMSITDRLWRNVAGESWSDVTEAAGLIDEGFGQGIGAGDFDNDGFPDLLVLNIGANVLWHNNGDGTFERSREFAGMAGDAWSLSAAIADLDDDSIPDIYVVNYLAGDDVYSRSCPDDSGKIRLTCQPHIFSPAPDQLLRGLGDGRFADSSMESHINEPVGRGMGLIVGRLTGSSALEVYVANDSTANSHFIRLNSANGLETPPQYINESFVRGNAVDSAGRAQASMGIAAGDADGDGRLDLFVTNFEGESNTLYLQLAEGMFSDRSQDLEMTAAGRSLLGFGTQFLDADLDGAPELIVANGHVNDRRDTGSLYQMPPQIFRNLAGRDFRIVLPEEAGSYFAGEYLGRGLAVLDWNRDGRPDAAISHLDRPAALLTNQSVARGRWLHLHCVGTVSARDAIGTTVSVHTPDRRVVRQLTAGDGYESSNQRIIFIGLGMLPDDSLTVTVKWPGGETVELTDVPIDREVVIIEGRSQVFPSTPFQRPPVSIP